jgi:hypothetical protein
MTHQKGGIMAKAKVSSKGTPKQEDFLDGFEVHMEEMSKMKYVDFRKAAAGLFATIHNAMIENIKWYAKDRDGYIDVITKKFKEIDESQKKFASGLNIDLDGWRAMVEREAIESPETAT